MNRLSMQVDRRDKSFPWPTMKCSCKESCSHNLHIEAHTGNVLEVLQHSSELLHCRK
jgi:hypothetical protein